MSSTLSRRNFLLGMGVGTIAFVSLDLSRVTGLNKAGSRIRFGYAAITWEGNDVQAINDISELGFPGIQLRSNILKDFGDRPGALRVPAV